MRYITLALAALIPACQKDETVHAYGAADRVWDLVEINEKPFTAKAELRFPEAGRIAGTAPCNSYSASMQVPYPWFETGPIISTRKACKDLQAEGTYLTKLGEMTLSEVLGDILILSDEDGQTMVFNARD